MYYWDPNAKIIAWLLAMSVFAFMAAYWVINWLLKLLRKNKESKIRDTR